MLLGLTSCNYDEGPLEPPPVEREVSFCSYDPDNTARHLPSGDLEECLEDCAFQHGRDIEACKRKKDPKKRSECYDKANQKNARCRRDCEKKYPSEK